jgi:hypothetical protein
MTSHPLTFPAGWIKKCYCTKQRNMAELVKRIIDHFEPQSSKHTDLIKWNMMKLLLIHIHWNLKQILYNFSGTLFIIASLFQTEYIKFGMIYMPLTNRCQLMSRKSSVRLISCHSIYSCLTCISITMSCSFSSKLVSYQTDTPTLTSVLVNQYTYWQTCQKLHVYQCIAYFNLQPKTEHNNTSKHIFEG